MYIWTKIQMKNTPQCQWGHIWNPRIIRVKVIYRIQKAMLMERNLNLFLSENDRKDCCGRWDYWNNYITMILLYIIIINIIIIRMLYH